MYSLPEGSSHGDRREPGPDPRRRGSARLVEKGLKGIILHPFKERHLARGIASIFHAPDASARPPRRVHLTLSDDRLDSGRIVEVLREAGIDLEEFQTATSGESRYVKELGLAGLDPDSLGRLVNELERLEGLAVSGCRT